MNQRRSVAFGATVTLSLPPEERYLAVLRLMISGALSADTDAGLVSGVQRAVDEVGRAILDQHPVGTLDVLLHHDSYGPIEVEVSAELASGPTDEDLLDAVDGMLDLISAAHERTLTGTTLNFSFTIRHLP